jgi:hypothetical protein
MGCRHHQDTNKEQEKGMTNRRSHSREIIFIHDSTACHSNKLSFMDIFHFLYLDVVRGSIICITQLSMVSYNIEPEHSFVLRVASLLTFFFQGYL